MSSVHKLISDVSDGDDANSATNDKTVSSGEQVKALMKIEEEKEKVEAPNDGDGNEYNNPKESGNEYKNPRESGNELKSVGTSRTSSISSDSISDSNKGIVGTLREHHDDMGTEQPTKPASKPSIAPPSLDDKQPPVDQKLQPSTSIQDLDAKNLAVAVASASASVPATSTRTSSSASIPSGKQRVSTLGDTQVGAVHVGGMDNVSIANNNTSASGSKTTGLCLASAVETAPATTTTTKTISPSDTTTSTKNSNTNTNTNTNTKEQKSHRSSTASARAAHDQELIEGIGGNDYEDENIYGHSNNDDDPGACHIGPPPQRNNNGNSFVSSYSNETPTAVTGSNSRPPPETPTVDIPDGEIVTAQLVNEEEIEADILSRKQEEIRQRIIQDSAMATVVTPDSKEEAGESSNKAKTQKFMYLLILLAVIVVGIVLGVVLSGKGGSGNDELGSSATLAPTTSLSPSEAPSDSPTLSEREFLLQLLSPLSGRDTLLDPTTPQYKALEWLVMEDTYQEFWPTADIDGDLSLESVVEDRYIVALLYFSTQGDSWNKPFGFLSNTSVCEWPLIESDEVRSTVNGVRCNTRGEVALIRLEINNLNGTIPEELTTRTSLEVLDFFQNHLTGTLMPALANLIRLENLELSRNDFTGTLPDSLGGLTKLEILSLYDNSLTGTIPPALPKIPSLDRFLLQTNKLSGTIPEFLTRSRITGVRLRNNMLNGTIPDSLFLNLALDTIDIGDNFLSGTLSTRVGDLRELTTLSLNDAGVGGTIPTEIGRLQQLTFLGLLNNQFYGTIPTELGNLGNLEKLVLEGNVLSGTIPTTFGLMTSLTSLFLTSNQLTGEIPQELASLEELRTGALHVGNNSFIGSLDKLFCNTSLPTPVFLEADCDEMECSCCTRCCTDIEGGCLFDLNEICGQLEYDLENCLECKEWWLAECECQNDGALVTCMDACESCNSDGSVCIKNVDYGYNLPESGIDHLYHCNMQYTIGRTESISYQIDYLTNECWFAIDGQLCNSCTRKRCEDGYQGIRVDCLNIAGDAMFDSCDLSMDGGGILQFIENDDFYPIGGCWPCV